jgi:hypothetical protein
LELMNAEPTYLPVLRAAIRAKGGFPASRSKPSSLYSSIVELSISCERGPVGEAVLRFELKSLNYAADTVDQSLPTRRTSLQPCCLPIRMNPNGRWISRLGCLAQMWSPIERQSQPTNHQ